MTMIDQTRPLVVDPVSPEYDKERFDREYVQGEPTKADERTVNVFGHCADFCEGTLDGDTAGASIADHGRLCQSRPLLWATAVDIAGTSFEVVADLVRPYHHGVYDSSVMPLPHDPLLAVRRAADADGNLLDPAESMFFDSGELRRIAAAFVRAADVMDGLDKPVNRR